MNQLRICVRAIIRFGIASSLEHYILVTLVKLGHWKNDYRRFRPIRISKDNMAVDINVQKLIQTVEVVGC